MTRIAGGMVLFLSVWWLVLRAWDVVEAGDLYAGDPGKPVLHLALIAFFSGYWLLSGRKTKMIGAGEPPFSGSGPRAVRRGRGRNRELQMTHSEPEGLVPVKKEGSSPNDSPSVGFQIAIAVAAGIVGGVFVRAKGTAVSGSVVLGTWLGFCVISVALLERVGVSVFAPWTSGSPAKRTLSIVVGGVLIVVSILLLALYPIV